MAQERTRRGRPRRTPAGRARARGAGRTRCCGPRARRSWSRRWTWTLSAPSRAGGAGRCRRPGALRDAVLAPPAGPVHRALLSRGAPRGRTSRWAGSCATAGDDAAQDGALVRLVVVREGAAAGARGGGEGGWASLLDVGAAEGAVEAMRASTANAVQYERAWFASGAAALAEWAYAGTKKVGALRPVHKAFVAAVLEDTAARIDVAEAGSRAPRQESARETGKPCCGR